MNNCMLLFDLDGTLWDSSKEVADSWNIVMQRTHPELPVLTPADLSSLMGKTMDEIAGLILLGMDPAERKALFRECEEFEIAYIAEHGAKLYPGVEETLKKLKEAGFRMGIVSNCQSGYISAFLTSMQMEPYFCDFEEWGNTKLSKSENIRLVMKRNHFDQAVYIGDTAKDQAASKGARLPFIHAAYGFGTVKDPDEVIRSFPELLDCLSRLKIL